MVIKNIPLVAARILRAISNQEKIILYGDADLDGVASVIILKESIEMLGSEYTDPKTLKVKVYFPDRENEGYGINEIALNNLKKEAPALLIALDCGIGNVREVEMAKEMGFEVIIIDHHQILPKIPKASIVVDPKQPSDPYPFKSLAAVGVVYQLVEFLLKDFKGHYSPDKFLELAMLATLADQVPIKEDNKKLVTGGVLAIKHTKRQGIKALMGLTGFQEGGVEEIRQKVLFPLNRAGLENHLHEAYLLLTEVSQERAKELANQLLERSIKRKAMVQDVYVKVEDRIKKEKHLSVIFEGSSSWPLVLLGTVASKICQKYKKPTFLFKIVNDDESVGTVRMPSDGDAVKAMIDCRHLLKTYGGHALAAGFRVKNENLGKFKDCLAKYFAET